MEKMKKWSLLAAIVGWGLMVTSCNQSEEADDLVHGPSIQMVTADAARDHPPDGEEREL